MKALYAHVRARIRRENEVYLKIIQAGVSSEELNDERVELCLACESTIA
jgi:hypothetical protein